MSKLKDARFGVGRLHTAAWKKGVLGGDRKWIAVGLLVWVPRLFMRAGARSQRTVALEHLSAGQSVRIESIRPLTRRQRRTAKRAAARAGKAAKAA